jgi:hypothetical protein
MPWLGRSVCVIEQGLRVLVKQLLLDRCCTSFIAQLMWPCNTHTDYSPFKASSKFTSELSVTQ